MTSTAICSASVQFTSNTSSRSTFRCMSIRFCPSLFSLICSMVLMKDLFLFAITALVLCHVAVLKCLSLHHPYCKLYFCTSSILQIIFLFGLLRSERVLRVSSYFPICGRSVSTRTQLKYEDVHKGKQFKHSTPKHKTIRTTTEASS